MKISADSSVCIGAGNCALTAPDLFDQSEQDGTVVVLEPAPDQDRLDEAQQAAQLCPSNAITVTEDE